MFDSYLVFNAPTDFDTFADIFNTGASSAAYNSHDDTLGTSHSVDALATSSPATRSLTSDKAGFSFRHAGDPPTRHPNARKGDSGLMTFAEPSLLYTGPTRSITSTQDDEMADSPFMSTEGDGLHQAGVNGSVKRYLATASLDRTVKVSFKVAEL